MELIKDKQTEPKRKYLELIKRIGLICQKCYQNFCCPHITT